MKIGSDWWTDLHLLTKQVAKPALQSRAPDSKVHAHFLPLFYTVVFKQISFISHIKLLYFLLTAVPGSTRGRHHDLQFDKWGTKLASKHRLVSGTRLSPGPGSTEPAHTSAPRSKLLLQPKTESSFFFISYPCPKNLQKLTTFNLQKVIPANHSKGS